MSRVTHSEPGLPMWRQPLTLPLYYERKTMKTIFPQNYVYVLRTATTRHMISSSICHAFKVKPRFHAFMVT